CTAPPNAGRFTSRTPRSGPAWTASGPPSAGCSGAPSGRRVPGAPTLGPTSPPSPQTCRTSCGATRPGPGGASAPSSGRRSGRPVAEVAGASAGGGAVRGWRLALDGKTLHDRAVVLAAVRGAGAGGFRLAGVGGVRAKARACAEEGACNVLIVPTKEDKRDAL